jgi:diadenosine tetraphosphate (Ap4A) HIT family hydrolase
MFNFLNLIAFLELLLHYLIMLYDRNNVFYRILMQQLPADILEKNKHVLIIKDKHPDAPIHNLVIPQGEYCDLRAFTNASDEEKLAFLNAILDQVNQIPEEDGAKVLINVGKAGGQEVFHLHAHILGGKGAREKHRTRDHADKLG